MIDAAEFDVLSVGKSFRVDGHDRNFFRVQSVTSLRKLDNALTHNVA